MANGISMIRVLFLCEFGTRNGGENSLLAVLPSLLQEGIQPIVAAPAPSELADQLIQQEVETVSWNPRIVTGQQDSIIQRREMIKQLVDTTQPDLVHANSLSMSRLAGPVTSCLGIASVGHLRDMMNISAQAIRDLNLHSRLLAVSKATRDWYVARGVDNQRVQVLYNGVALDQFFPNDTEGSLYKQLGLDKRVPILGG
ncbi:MAG: glycosyltransferase family 4 protein, partial [Planctomycetaceae bacterium]|nr:glycosyltransferase family 4 protein [Planctomycetaceae bacterium]